VATPLRTLLDGVFHDDEMRHAFADDPATFLDLHGHGDLSAADVQEAMFVLADASATAPATALRAGAFELGDPADLDASDAALQPEVVARALALHDEALGLAAADDANTEATGAFGEDEIDEIDDIDDIDGFGNLDDTPAEPPDAELDDAAEPGSVEVASHDSVVSENVAHGPAEPNPINADDDPDLWDGVPSADTPMLPGSEVAPAETVEDEGPDEWEELI
jgi:hypothetical protein